MHLLSGILLCFFIPGFWLAASQGQTQSESMSICDDLFSKRNTLFSFLFKSRRLSVWKDNVTQPGREQFFVTSVPRFVPASLDCKRSFLTVGNKLVFLVEMWSHSIQDAAINAIQEHLGIRPTPNQVQPLPFQKIRLVRRSAVGTMDPSIVLDSTWLPNTLEPFGHKFSFWIENLQTCLNVKQEILRDPESFVTELKVQGLLSTESHSFRMISVSSRHITSSTLFASLRTMNPPGNIRFLQSKDVNRLAQQIAFQVIATEISHVDYVPTEDELSLQQLITSHLSTEKTNSSSFTSQNQWDSVFWEPTFARPDKIADFLQKTTDFDQGNRRFSWNGTKAEEWARAQNTDLKAITDFFNRNDYSRVDTGSTSARLRFFGLFELGGSLEGRGEEHSNNISHNKEGHSKVNQMSDQGGRLQQLSEDQLKSWLQNNDIQVLVRGKIFHPKPVALWRLNLNDLEQMGALLTKRIQVRRVQIETSFQVGLKDPNEKENCTTMPATTTSTSPATSTSCHRNIPKSAAVVGIEYESEEPWIPTGGKANITCVQSECQMTSRVAECVGGIWEFKPCKTTKSLMMRQEISIFFALLTFSLAQGMAFCKITEGLNPLSNDIGNMVVVATPEACCAACAIEPGCVAWAMNLDNGRCFLKNAYNPDPSYNPRRVGGMRTSCYSYKPGPSGVRLTNFTISSHPNTEDLKACIKLCTNSPYCVTAVYQATGGVCELNKKSPIDPEFLTTPHPGAETMTLIFK